MPTPHDARHDSSDRSGFRAEYHAWFRRDALSRFAVELLGRNPYGRGHTDQTDDGITGLLYAFDGKYSLAWIGDAPNSGRRVIFDGDTEWRITPGETITASDKPRAPFRRLLEPRLSRPGLTALDEPEHPDLFDGRPVHRLRFEQDRSQPGRHRSSAPESERSGLLHIAELIVPDAVEILIDDELGIAVSDREFRNGDCIRNQWLAHITPITDIDDSAFVFVPPRGAKIARLSHASDGRPEVKLPVSIAIGAVGRILRAATRLPRNGPED